MRVVRLFTTTIAALALGLAPAFADGVGPAQPPTVANKRPVGGNITLLPGDVGATPCSGTCVAIPAFLAQLSIIASSSSFADLETSIPDAPSGPIVQEFRGGTIHAGGALAAFVASHYGLTTAQVTAVMAAAGATMSSLVPVPPTLTLAAPTTLAQIGGVGTGRLVAAGSGLTGGGDLSADRTLGIAIGGVAPNMMAAGAAAANLGFSPLNPAGGDASAAMVTLPGGARPLNLASRKGCQLLDVYGADPTGATASDTAMAAVLTVIGTSNGCVEGGAGTYKFSAAVYKSLVANQSIRITGAGKDATTFYWPSGGGVILSRSNGSTFTVDDLSLVTGAKGGSNAITLNDGSPGGCAGGVSQSVVQNVAMRGADGIGQSDYWSTGIYATDVNLLNVYGVDIFGEGTNTKANGIYYAGSGTSSSTTCLAVVNNVTSSYFQSLANGYILGQSAQGVTITQSNFNSSLVGISTIANAYDLDELTVVASQFNTSGSQINLSSGINDVMVSGNLFFVPPCCSGFLATGGVNGLTVVGNTFRDVPGQGAGGSGVALTGTTGYRNGGAIIGNRYQALINGNLFTSTAGFVTQANSFFGVTTPNNVAAGCSGCTSVIQALDYGAKCDGSTDDTAALNAFFARLATVESNAVEEVLPAGTCVFTNTLLIPLSWSSLHGAGAYTTTLMYKGTSTTIDLVQIANGSTPVGPGTISGFEVQSQTTMTGGWGIHLHDGSRIRIKDLIADGQNGNGKLQNGLWLDEFDFITLDQYEARAQNIAFGVSGPGTSGNPGPSNGPQFDLWAEHGKILNSHIGVLIGGGVDNVFFDKTMDTSNDYDVTVDNSLSSFKNQEVSFGSQFVADAANNDDYYINDSLASRSQYCTMTIGGPVTGSRGGNGINIAHWPSCFVIVKGAAIQINHSAGIASSDTSAYLSVDDGTVISDNGTYGIAATSAWSLVKARGWIVGNTSGALNNVTLQ